MPRFTVEQNAAIFYRGGNCLVSAAAGSGKTAVLSERLKQLLIEGVDLSSLIVLTFTKAASTEMKERIYDVISSTPDIISQLDNIPDSNITTFDSYSFKLVKQYHYLLGIEANIAIGDSAIFEIKKVELIDNYFNSEYLIGNQEFINLLDHYCVYDDNTIKSTVLEIYKQFDNYLTISKNSLKVYNQDTASILFDKYENIVLNKIEEIKKFINDMSTEALEDAEINYYEKTSSALKLLTESTNYDEFYSSGKMSIPRFSLKNKTDNWEQMYILKEKIKEELDALESFKIYHSKSHAIDIFLKVKPFSNKLIDIIILIDKELKEFKKEIGLYEYIDIKRMAIELLENNQNIRNDIKEYTTEILLDEYQDTDDIQEYFISLISDNNVFMVGDIKQSIYGFRNANPKIFIDKYQKYENDEGGKLLTLTKNFRSNLQVIDSVNDIFKKLIMPTTMGINYDVHQQLNYGNLSYDNQPEEDFKTQIIDYIDDESKEISAIEKEAMIVAQDIKDKIYNSTKIMSNGVIKILEPSDICVLVRGKKDFSTVKKVFDSMGVPLYTHSSVDFKHSEDIVTFKALYNIVTNNNFKRSFLTVMRSYLYSIDDISFHNSAMNINTFSDMTFSNVPEIVELYNKILKIRKDTAGSNIDFLSQYIINIFELVQKSYILPDGHNSFERLNHVLSLSSTFDKAKLSKNDFSKFMVKLDSNSNMDIQFDISLSVKNVVQIMTIHKSKGLQYPVVYLLNNDKKYNSSDTKKDYIITKEFGLIMPYIDKSKYQLFTKELYKDYQKKSMINEEIRVLYVALTRAESKLIILINRKNRDERHVYSTKSVQDLILASDTEKYIVDHNESIKFEFSKVQPQKYNNSTIALYKPKYKIDFKIKSRPTEKKNVLIDKPTQVIMRTGTKMHEFLELVDFKNIDKNLYTPSEFETILDISNYEFIKKSIFIYKEYEYVYKNNGKEQHGIIDMLVECEDKYVIVDFKYSNIDNSTYNKQLEIYKEYIMTITNKKIDCYLYSIKKRVMKRIF